jgi:hypothetical protein
MTGRIKSGEGILMGNAGEFYVAAELLKRGVVAALGGFGFSLLYYFVDKPYQLSLLEAACTETVTRNEVP